MFSQLNALRNYLCMFSVPTTRRPAGGVGRKGISRPNSVVCTEEEPNNQNTDTSAVPPPIPARVAVNNSNSSNSNSKVTESNTSQALNQSNIGASSDNQTGGGVQKKVLPSGASLPVLQQPMNNNSNINNNNNLSNLNNQNNVANNKDANC